MGTGNTEFVDAVTEGQFRSQPQEMFGRYNMGATAEKIAETLGITREEQDAFSFASQQKAIAAIDAGKFKDEIVPVVVPQGQKKSPIVFDTNEFPKRDTSMEKMGKLKPCFNITTDDQGRIYNSSELTGTVTAASSSGRDDGASCMLLMTEEKAKELGLKPICRIDIGMGTAGCDPRTMGLGPVYAVPKALKNAGLTIDDIQLIEPERGICRTVPGLHQAAPLGGQDGHHQRERRRHCPGPSRWAAPAVRRILVSLMHEMKQRGPSEYGLATLCIAGGMGQATVVELL